MIERRESRANASKRQCARFGCSALATATYTFDSATCTVWLDTPFDDAARAGELCTRHAQSLTPPRGWRLEDRRQGPGREVAEPTTSSASSSAGPSPSASSTSASTSTSSASTAPAPPKRALSRAELDDELRGLLDAQSPLLERAFRSSGAL